MRVPAKISLHKLVLYVYTNIRLAKGDAVHTAFLDRQLKLLTHETDYRSTACAPIQTALQTNGYMIQKYIAPLERIPLRSLTFVEHLVIHLSGLFVMFVPQQDNFGTYL